MLATFEASVAPLSLELKNLDPTAKLRTICIPQAMTALNAGDGATQFSTARAKSAVSKAVKCAALTSPESAVLRMKELV